MIPHFARTLGRPDLDALVEKAEVKPSAAVPNGVVVYLTGMDVVAHRGHRRMPPYDAKIGTQKGWLPTSVDGDATVRPSNVTVYLGRTEVAHHLGLKTIRSLNGIKLPPHDAQIGARKGWLAGTIDAWNAKRPGRGRWGARSI